MAASIKRLFDSHADVQEVGWSAQPNPQDATRIAAVLLHFGRTVNAFGVHLARIPQDKRGKSLVSAVVSGKPAKVIKALLQPTRYIALAEFKKAADKAVSLAIENKPSLPNPQRQRGRPLLYPKSIAFVKAEKRRRSKKKWRTLFNECHKQFG